MRTTQTTTTRTKTMLFGNLASTLLFIASFLYAHSAPAKPLNERSAQLTWQAWILVDDQNQNQRNGDDATIPKRRITPKSIFISPLLEQCGAGYAPDPHGKCIKLVPLDNDAHMKFILELLNSKFSSGEDYDDEEEEEAEETLPTPGPFQLNIPLDFNNATTAVGSSTSHADTPLIITKIHIDEQTTVTIPPPTTTTLPSNDDFFTTLTTTMDATTTTTELPTTITTEDIPTTISTTIAPDATTTTSPFNNDDSQASALFFKVVSATPHPPSTNWVRFPDDDTTTTSIIDKYPHKFVNHRSRDKWFFPSVGSDDDSTRGNQLYRDTPPVENLPYIFGGIKHHRTAASTSSSSSQR